jgi:hypothetical protein
MSRSSLSSVPCLLALSLVWLALLAPPCAAAPGGAAAELLKNPGFEDPLEGHPWMPAEWDTSQTDLATVFFGRDTFLVRSGHYAVSIANTSQLVPVWHNWNQSVVVGPESWGKDAVFSVWTRSNGQQGRAYVLIQAYRDTIGKTAKQLKLPRDMAGKRIGINKLDDPLLDTGWKRLYFADTETDWVQRQVRVYVPPSTNMIYVRCGLVGTGQVLFDDASLTLDTARPVAAVPVGVNLLTDAGFEGDGNAWEYSMPPYSGQRIERDTTVARTGRGSVRFGSGDEGYVQARAGVCQVFDRRLAGKHVRLTGWVRTDSVRLGVAYIRLYCNSLSKGMVQSDPGPTVDLTHDWTKLTLEMDVPRDAVEVWPWFAWSVPANGTVWYDDTSFEVTSAGGPARAAPRTIRPATPPAKPATPPAKPATPPAKPATTTR